MTGTNRPPVQCGDPDLQLLADDIAQRDHIIQQELEALHARLKRVENMLVQLPGMLPSREWMDEVTAYIKRGRE